MLEELIEECGFDFRDLVQHSPRSKEGNIRWTAKGGLKKFGHWKLFSADTPKHAVEKLLKELNKKS